MVFTDNICKDSKNILFHKMEEGSIWWFLLKMLVENIFSSEKFVRMIVFL